MQCCGGRGRKGGSKPEFIAPLENKAYFKDIAITLQKYWLRTDNQWNKKEHTWAQ